MVAAELRRQADVFLDIVELQPKIGRDPAERAAREARERHTPQFLQHPTAPQPAGAGAPLDQARRSWQKACEILLAAADGLADVRAATRQVELALFQQAKWMAKRSRSLGSSSVRRAAGACGRRRCWAESSAARIPAICLADRISGDRARRQQTPQLSPPSPVSGKSSRGSRREAP